MRNEKDVKAKVKKILDKHDWFWFMPPSNAYGKSGISDFIAVKNGTFLAIETKFGSNKPTALQVAFLNSIRNAHGFGFIVNEKNIDWLDGFLESFEVATIAQSKKEEVSDEHGARMVNGIKELTELI